MTRSTFDRILAATWRSGAVLTLGCGAVACGSDATTSEPAAQETVAQEPVGDPGETVAPTLVATSDAAPAATDAPPQAVTSPTEPVQSADLPEGWFDGVPTPLATDGVGGVRPDSFELISNEVSNGVRSVTFRQTAGAAIDGFSGVAKWGIEQLQPDAATPCTNEVFWAAASTGVASCSGTTSDGRSVNVATAYDMSKGSPIPTVTISFPE